MDYLPSLPLEAALEVLDAPEVAGAASVLVSLLDSEDEDESADDDVSEVLASPEFLSLDFDFPSFSARISVT